MSGSECANKVVEMKSLLNSENERYLKKYQEIVLINEKIVSAIEIIKKALFLKTNIFIFGESGVGKTIIAKIAALQYKKESSFIEVNVNAIPEGLFESTLFGHKKGAFTGATRDNVGCFVEADNGILFLDEIGDLSPSCQAKLLSAIESDYVVPVGSTSKTRTDVSFIFASNKNIANLKTFRDDLYYRICGISVYIPSIRERVEDLEILANYFLKQLNDKFPDNSPKILGPDVINLLKLYHWPGNIRELKNEFFSAFINADQRQKIIRDDLSRKIFSPINQSKNDDGKSLFLSAMEKDLVITALNQSDWVQKEAALKLGISPRRMNYKVDKYNITHPNWRANSGKKTIKEET